MNELTYFCGDSLSSTQDLQALVSELGLGIVKEKRTRPSSGPRGDVVEALTDDDYRGCGCEPGERDLDYFLNSSE
jgi:hypothetical protein